MKVNISGGEVYDNERSRANDSARTVGMITVLRLLVVVVIVVIVTGWIGLVS